jgi:hypothetical protein
VFVSLCSFSQIRVKEALKSDTTQYSQSNNQDSVFIVYKGDNNKSSITLYADFNDIDSLNYYWYKYNYQSKSFHFLIKFDTVKNCEIKYDDPTQDMNKYEGGYRVHIFNQDKGIDTTFTAWVWYQDFFINSVFIYSSTCTNLELMADTSFQDVFTYYDLSVSGNPPLKLTNETILKWTVDPGSSSDIRYGVNPRFLAPVEATTYTVTGIDKYGFTRERTATIDETRFDSRGYPYLRAVKAAFSAIHGLETDDNKRSDTVVNVEAPHGVWFFNDSKNAELFEWKFYNHIDWYEYPDDSILFTTTFFEPSDSIFYKHPVRNSLSPKGYDVQLKVEGPVYNDDGDRCVITEKKINFVIVDSTQFPREYKELPNVFTPNASTNNYFYFVHKPESSEKPVKSISYFSIKIYNRWGNKVYEYEDNDGSWQERGKAKPGWDGTTRVGTKAKPGVYYYVILAKGWNGEDFKVGGFVHIF